MIHLRYLSNTAPAFTSIASDSYRTRKPNAFFFKRTFPGYVQAACPFKFQCFDHPARIITFKVLK